MGVPLDPAVAGGGGAAALQATELDYAKAALLQLGLDWDEDAEMRRQQRKKERGGLQGPLMATAMTVLGMWLTRRKAPATKGAAMAGVLLGLAKPLLPILLGIILKKKA